MAAFLELWLITSSTMLIISSPPYLGLETEEKEKALLKYNSLNWKCKRHIVWSFAHQLKPLHRQKFLNSRLVWEPHENSEGCYEFEKVFTLSNTERATRVINTYRNELSAVSIKAPITWRVSARAEILLWSHGEFQHGARTWNGAWKDLPESVFQPEVKKGTDHLGFSARFEATETLFM